MSKGIRYNESKLRWRNFPLYLFRPVVQVADAAEKREGNPTGKYPTLNYLKGLSVTDTLDSLQRHLDLLLDPSESDLDPEDGQHHLAKIAWNALVALHYIDTEHDDREMKFKPKCKASKEDHDLVDRQFTLPGGIRGIEIEKGEDTSTLLKRLNAAAERVIAEIDQAKDIEEKVERELNTLNAEEEAAWNFRQMFGENK